MDIAKEKSHEECLELVYNREREGASNIYFTVWFLCCSCKMQRRKGLGNVSTLTWTGEWRMMMTRYIRPLPLSASLSPPPKSNMDPPSNAVTPPEISLV